MLQHVAATTRLSNVCITSVYSELAKVHLMKFSLRACISSSLRQLRISHVQVTGHPSGGSSSKTVKASIRLRQLLIQICADVSAAADCDLTNPLWVVINSLLILSQCLTPPQEADSYVFSSSSWSSIIGLSLGSYVVDGIATC